MIDPQDIQFNPFKQNRYGGGFVNFDGIIIRTPTVHVPFSISDYNGNEKFKITFQHRSDKCDELFIFLHALDDFMKKEVFKQNEWKKYLQGINEEAIDMFYVPIVKTHEKFPDSFRANINYSGRGIKTKIINNEDNEDLRGSKVKALVEINCLWFAQNRFGFKINCHNIKVRSTS